MQNERDTISCHTSGSLHSMKGREPEPPVHRQSNPHMSNPQMTGADADRDIARDILYRLKRDFGEQWPKRFVKHLHETDKERLFKAVVYPDAD
jgi:hypothetical protein